ncbi:hypothetical protein HY612_02680 [Candidatus Roizmanbacteria bacterium]|nr:hypothetical protein [Candidatus Roizmanbacteria bacterium]
MQVVPTTLEKTVDSLFVQIYNLLPYFKIFQIDISDGLYTPNKTVQIEEIMSYKTQSINQVTFDFHLMVKDYETEIQKLKILKGQVNIDNIFIHYSLFPDYESLSEKYPEFRFGLVINVQDSVELFAKRYPNTSLPLIQLMTIDLGYQSLPFKPEMLQKIEQLKNLGYRSKIFIDGGINDKTLPFILSQEYKPDVLVIGSFLIRAENLKQRVDYLKEKVK